VRIDLNDLKMVISDINDKERSERLAAVREDELRKDGKKSWEMMENTSINSYCINQFFLNCNKEIAKNQQELLH